ncbi:MAG: Maf family protein, partial [Phycisphaeraceae bacterium]|nr:Maf family protein [Phycisphaeraceae bacterium]
AQTCQSAGDLRTQTLVDTATVHLGKVGPDELQRYLDTQQWRGKAGGYNLFERQNRWPLRVEGDPTTVVGLPMRKLVPTLLAWNIEPAGFIANDFKTGAP